MESKSDRFESKIDSFRTMPAGTARDRARPLVEMMVRQQQAIRGQKMSAYDDVGGWLGVKRTWVRRLLGGQEVGMSGDRLLRIAAAYRKHCAAVEQSTTKERADHGSPLGGVPCDSCWPGRAGSGRPWPRCRVGPRFIWAPAPARAVRP